jgi:hypothetical protein
MTNQPTDLTQLARPSALRLFLTATRIPRLPKKIDSRALPSNEKLSSWWTV